MKIKHLKLAALLMAGTVLTSSCIGSYSLFNKFAKWNVNATSSKFLNAVIGVVLLPVYGICSDDNGNFITTDFSGNVYVVSSGKQQLLVKKRQGINAAGIGYIPEQKLLAVPTYANNSIEIYEIGRYLQQNK